MAAFFWGPGGAQMTPDQIAAQRKIAEAMMLRGSDYSPVQSWSQGAARVAESLVGGLQERRADEAAKANAASEAALISSLFTGGGAPAAAPAPAATTATTPTTVTGNASLPRGIRNNNPLNIEAGTFTSGLPGYTGSDGRFARFETPDQGVNAADRLLGTYANKYGLNTVSGIVGRWAPTSDGNNVSSYAANVSKQLGVDPNAPLNMADPELRRRLIGAMGQHENGRPIQVASLGTAPVSAAAPAAPPESAATPSAVQTVAAAAAAPAAGVNPRIMAAMASPYISDGTKKVLGIMLQSQLASEGVNTIDLGNKVLLTDKRGNPIREISKGEPNKGPEYGVIGKDAFGNEQYGWRDPRTQTVTPTAPQGATQPTVTGPDGKPIMVQPGQDPKVIREAASKATAAAALPATFEDTAKLRHEVTQLPSYKNLSQAAPIYQSMAEAAGRNTKAADLNLVYGLGKIMDPGSVVREGEIQMANNAQGWQEKLNGIIAQINGQGGLTPEGRQALMAEAYGRIGAYKAEFDRDAARYKGITERNRMNTADVIPDFGTFSPWMAPKAGSPVVIDGYTIKAK